jgi:lipopolysaccharide export LptBFGC system permease protein LptF
MTAFIEESSSLKTVLDFLQPLLMAVVAIVTAWGISLAKTRGDKVEAAAEDAKKAAAIVAQKVEESTKQQTQVLSVVHDVHTLVNSQYGIALALINTQARAKLADAKLIAALNSDQAKKEQYEQDILLAKLNVEDSEKKLAEHEAKQHVVDIRDAKDAKDAKE